MKPRKLTKEDIDKVRHIEGFPIGTDEDIIALSNAPYYTACPNPFIDEFIRENGTPYDEDRDDYHREPFASDVSEGKTDPMYLAHTYHTKVPYKAIMRYILHYTKPGDIVLDGFCGTGMTGVAAYKCGFPDEDFKIAISKEMKDVEWGTRKAILSDLSPAATFIASNYNTTIDVEDFLREGERIVAESEKENGWLYNTEHENEGSQLSFGMKGVINYVLWSDVFICPNCGEEIVFWNAAVDTKVGKLRNEFNCPKCGLLISKRKSERCRVVKYDKYLGECVSLAKQVPVLISYNVGKKEYKKKIDNNDLEIIRKSEELKTSYDIPINLLPKGYNTAQPIRSHNFKRIHYFYTNRNLYVIADLMERIENSKYPRELLFVMTSLLNRVSKLSNLHVSNFFHGRGGAAAGNMKGIIYVPSTSLEQNVLSYFKVRLKAIAKVFNDKKKDVYVSTNSCTDLGNINSNSIDYIFTDPPFGANIMYSELNFLWEAWLKILTKNDDEAIMNDVQGKSLMEYQNLMTKCFSEYFRVLKPNHWITIEFHNSKNAVWNAIQEAINRAGFIVSDVRTLDKKQGSFKQVTTSSAVKQDLVISAYKPKESFKNKFIDKAGTEEIVWDFVHQHLENIPIIVVKNGKIEIISERQAYLLFDRMVAYHIINGIHVPIDATDFYRGLDEKFLKRDGMYFLPDQVNEYDNTRIKTDVESIQFSMLVTNEKTAISWLYQQLSEEFIGPQTYQELQPKFMQEVKSIDKFENMPELSVLLEENFLQDEKGRWYIPDITKEGDVAKLREKNLMKEFEGYLNSKGKLKLFRSEAIRVGFSKLWKDKNYQAIVDLAERLPEKVIQEDSNLLMYYDISLSRI